MSLQKKKGKGLAKSEDSSKAKRKAPKENKGGGGLLPKVEVEEQRVPPPNSIPLEVKGESVVSGSSPRTPLRPARPPSAKRRRSSTGDQPAAQGTHHVY